MISPAHLSCSSCRIRLQAGAPEVVLLDERCPLCGAALSPVSSSAAVLGFRWFGTEMLAEWSEDRQSGPLAPPVELASRRPPAIAGDDLDAGRWSDDGGNIVSAVSPPPPPA